MTSLEVIALKGLPLIKAGDDLVELIASKSQAERRRAAGTRRACRRAEDRLEGRGPHGRPCDDHALRAGDRPRGECRQGPATCRGHIVGVCSRRAGARQRADRRAQAWLHHGECRSGPIERGTGDGTQRVLLLPEHPDRSAAALRDGLAALTGTDLAVVINDSFGRAWRQGTAGVAIGVAGLPALIDLRGRPDLFGRTLEVSVIGFADEVAAAGSLVMGQADEAAPVVLIRGLRWSAPESTAASLIRPSNEDLFR